MNRDEKIQGLMGLILISHTKFLASLEKHQESIGKIENVVLRLANTTLDRFEKNEEKIAMLIDAQLRTEQKIEQLTDLKKAPMTV